MEGQDAQQRPLSSREGPSVKCVFLQFEKVESGQIGILLSSNCMSYVTVGGGGGSGVHEGGGTALIDTFSSSERGVKPSVVLKRGIPGQTDCLYGDGHGWVGGWGGALSFLDETGCWKWIYVTGQRHGPHNTLQPQGLSILYSAKRLDMAVHPQGHGAIQHRSHGLTADTESQRGGH